MIQEITGLWLNEDSKTGKKTMSGKIGKLKVIVVKNQYKKVGSKEPDYKLLAVINEKEPTDGKES